MKIRGLSTVCDRNILDQLDWFLRNVLIGNGFTHWVAEVNLRYDSHPELTGIRYNPELPLPNPATYQNPSAIAPGELKTIAEQVRRAGVELVPLVNHWGWNLLTFVYPDLAENTVMPKAACPRHPKVQAITKDLFDEVIGLTQPRMFHAGMDEINVSLVPFHNMKWSDQIGICPRCNMDKPAAVMAGEINRVNAYFKGRSCRMMMWADQLLNPPDYHGVYHERDGTHGDETWLAVDTMDQDVIACDWHYGPSERYPSVDFLLRHGLGVVGCVAPYSRDNIINFTRYVRGKDSPNALGMLMTFWGQTCKRSQARQVNKYGFIDDQAILEMIALAGKCFNE